MDRSSPRRVLTVFPACVLVVLGVLGASVDAAVLGFEDWKTPGDQQLLRDSSTGIQWLNVFESHGMTFPEVSAQLGPSGVFEGFRFATAAEVTTLFHDAGVKTIGSMTFDPAEASALLFLSDHWCFTFSTVSGALENRFGSFFVADESAGQHGIGQFEVDLQNGVPMRGIASPITGYADASFRDISLGSALVRFAPVVPEPSTLVLWALLGAIGFGIRRCWG